MSGCESHGARLAARGANVTNEKKKVSLAEAEALGLYRMLGRDGKTIERSAT
jgi:hypothetical protein